jgi:hypothetical protein
VMGCPQCGPALKERWKAPAYLARLKRNIQSGIHKVVVASRDPKGREDSLVRGEGPG